MAKRLDLLKQHLVAAPSPSRFQFPNEGTGLAAYRNRGTALNAEVMRRAADGSIWEYVQQSTNKAATIPMLNNLQYHDTSRTNLREIYVKQILAYFGAMRITLEEDEQDSRKVMGWLMGLWGVNQGLAIRLSVHIILYADTIRALGTEKHRQYVERAWKLQDYGSFSLTELGHGSNASGVETTATYDYKTREFVLHTPNSLAAKWWIGAVGKTANMTVVFARMVLHGNDYGVHVFLVPIRDYETHTPLPGVVIGDCGPKEGCQGIDNGFLLFENYRVPYDALLDKYSHLSMDGKLKTAIKNKEKRFSAMLGGLIRGRFGVSSGALLSLRNGLTIAVRYSANRTQFGPPNKPELPILDYQITRYRLMPHLANFFAASAGIDLIRNLIEKHKATISESPDGLEAAEIHALLSIIKPLCSWYTQKGLQEFREMLAGHGYSSFAGLSTLLADNDVNNTWEGENNVLLQQTSRYIFKNVQRILKGQRIDSEYLSFLSIDPAQTEGKAVFVGKEQLRDNLGVLRKAMEFRTNTLVRKSMIRMQENGAKYQSMLETWNNTQVFHLHSLSISFGEMVLTNELCKAAESSKAICPVSSAMLTRIAELYVLSRVAGDMGAFRENDYFSTEQANIAKDYLIDVCSEVGESSVRIVDAIAIPEQLIGSAFAVSDGKMYKAYLEMVESAEGCYQGPTWVGLIKESRKAL